MAMNSEYRGSASGVAAAKKKAATKKTVATPGTKVSQATIDKIKSMGMKKALAGAANASPEMREGLKRMYGASRVAAATPSKPAAKSADAARAAAAAGPKFKSADSARRSATPVKPVAKSPDAARRQNMPNTPTTKTKAVNMPNKKSGTTDPFARAVFTAGGAVKKALTGGDRMTVAQVAAENKRRAAAVAAAKAKKNK